jgi:tetratricopeptide (TPR) repeat protein
MDVEDVRGTLRPYHELLRAELERYGGTVEKFIGDAVMALFGAPAAHEDDPERAVRAAFAIHEQIARLRDGAPNLDLHVRIGITTGEALVTLSADPGAGEGMASGDVVNTGARLQSAAPVDGVLVDETTWRATNRIVSYLEAAPVDAKGKSAPVRVWIAQGIRSRQGAEVDQRSSAPLIGRSRQVRLLSDAFEQAREDRRAQLTTIVGVPGIGKSRLVYEFSQWVDALDELVNWRQGRSLPYGEGVAFWALSEIVKAEAGIYESDAPEAGREKLQRAIAALIDDREEAERLERQLAPLVGIDPSSGGTGDGVEDPFAVWRRFLEALAARRPTVLVFEDLHWADDGMLDFITHLVEWAGDVPLFCVCTARPELLERRPAWGGGIANSSLITLSPLSSEDTARLVSALLMRAVIPDEVQRALLERADGNPLYAEEYVRMLRNRGGDELQSLAGADLTGAATPALPDSVSGIIAARLDGITASEKLVVQAAAVMGKVVWAGAVTEISGVADDDAQALLHRLERKEFLRRERHSSVAGETEYAFRHVLIRDVSYGQIPRAERARMHESAASWIERSAPERDDHVEMLAHHYKTAVGLRLQTGQDPSAVVGRAVDAYMQAGRRALALGSYATALAYAQDADSLLDPEDARRPEIAYITARTRFELEPGVPDVLDEAVGQLITARRLEQAAEVETMIAVRLANAEARVDDGYQHARRAVDLLADRPPSPQKGWALATVGSFLVLGGSTAHDPRSGVRVCEEALEVCSHLPADVCSDVAASAEFFLAEGLLTLGSESARVHIERAARLAQDARSEAGLMARFNVCATLIQLGDLAQAEKTFAGAAARARELGSAHAMAGQVPLYAADFAYHAGDWQRAQEGTTAVAGSGVEYVAIWAHEHLVSIAWARGDPGLADLIERGLELARPNIQTQAGHAVLTECALALAETGALHEAGALANEALDTASTAHWHPSFVRLSLCLDRLGRGDDVHTVTRQLPLDTPWRGAASAIARGEYEAAALTLGDVGARPDQALCRLHAARYLVESGRRDEATPLTRASLEFWREVNADRMVAECDALLALATR